MLGWNIHLLKSPFSGPKTTSHFVCAPEQNHKPCSNQGMGTTVSRYTVSRSKHRSSVHSMH